jgi:hypothetical protein
MSAVGSGLSDVQTFGEEQSMWRLEPAKEQCYGLYDEYTRDRDIEFFPLFQDPCLRIDHVQLSSTFVPELSSVIGAQSYWLSFLGDTMKAMVRCNAGNFRGFAKIKLW